MGALVAEMSGSAPGVVGEVDVCSCCEAGARVFGEWVECEAVYYYGRGLEGLLDGDEG
jgi:hypothetical protein